MKFKLLFCMVLCTILAGASSFAWAQQYPSRPITLVVTVPAGGSIDAVARFISNDLSKTFGQPVVVVNRPGAGGNIAAEYVANASPDGHTLLITSSSTMVLNPFVYKSISFDPVKSFVPVGIPAAQNLLLVVPAKRKIATLNELLALLKSKPGALNYASSGSGSVPHLASVLFSLHTDTSATHIPYGGIAPAVNALLAGDVDYMFDASSTIPNIRAGKVRALAVVGPKHLAALPNVPTFRELGLPQMEAARGWYGIFAPTGTPSEIVQRLNHEIVRIMNQPQIVAKTSAVGLDNVTSTPEELAAMMREDLARFGPIVKQTNMRAE